MKIKFNKLERVAGLFVGSAILGSLFVMAGVAVKRGWFASKVSFETLMTSAEGIHMGTLVQVSGLRAGSVSEVELLSANKVRVRFEVLEKFQPQIRQDSVIQVVRPFIIGDKVIEVTVGDEAHPQLTAGSYLPVRDSFDIMDLLSGKKMGPIMGTLERLSENLRALGDAFADPERTRALVNMFDRLSPLLKNMNEMAVGVIKITDTVNRQKRLEVLISNLAEISGSLGQIVPSMLKEAPDMGRQLGQMVSSLNILTSEMQKLAPAIAAVAPELPKTSVKAVEALNETVVLLKALQKSFLLRGKVEEVREEERKPASSK